MKKLFVIFSGFIVCCNVYAASSDESRKVRVHWLPVVQALDEIRGTELAKYGSFVRASENLERYMYSRVFPVISNVQYSEGQDDARKDQRSLFIDIRYFILHRKFYKSCGVQQSSFLRLRREKFEQLPAIVVSFPNNNRIESLGLVRPGGWRVDFTDRTALLLYFDKKADALIAAFFTAQEQKE